MFSIGGITIQEEEQEGDNNEKEVDAVDDLIFITIDDGMMGGFGWHHAIIDTGCNKSVAGDKWIEEYIGALSDEQMKKVTAIKPNKPQKFKFGGGTVCQQRQK